MELSKNEEYELQLALFQSRHEGGVRAVYGLLKLWRAEMEKKWPDAVDEQLVRLQGSAKQLDRLVSLIENGPRVKPERKIETTGGTST